MKGTHMVKRALVVLFGGLALVVGACGRVDVVGSRFVKSADVSEPTESLIEVGATEELALAGTQLRIPAGAVTGTVRVTLELGFAPISSSAIGPVAIWEPSGLRFSKKATMRLPIDLPTQASASEVYIEVLEASGERRQLTPMSVKEGYVTFEVDGFTSFQASLRSADGGVDAGMSGCVGASCLDGGFDSGLDAGGIDGGVDGGRDGGFDAGTSDGGGFDAGAFDAGAFDAGAFDAGAFDAGAFDAGAFDAGAFDAGAFDGGVFDAGVFDAGRSDGGAGVGDGGTPPDGGRDGG